MKSLRLLTTCSLLQCRCMAAAALLGSIGAALAEGTNYPATILSNNPSAYYRFEETSGGVASDSSVNNVSAAYNFNSAGSPQLGLPGIDTNSILFSGGGPGGASDYGDVDIPASQFITPLAADGSNSAPFSAELWVEPTVQPSSYEVPLEVAAYPNGWNFYVTGADVGTSSYFKLNMPNVLFQTVGNPVQFLTWYHLVFTYDGTNALVYINGVANGPYKAALAPAVGSDAHVGSGQGVGWLPFLGGVDEVAFYTNVLTASEVSNHYVIGTNSFLPGNVPPGIVSGPFSETNYSGLAATFSVGASGTTPLHYSWYSNSVAVGPNADSLSFTAQYPENNNASIEVVITNKYGSYTSSVVTLTVLTNVNIVSPPGSIARNVGSYAAFHVTVDGAVPTTYQWSVSSDGGTTYIPISAVTNQTATNDTLWLSSVQLSQNGNMYSVLVSNPFTSLSQSATLTVQTRSDPAVPLTGYGAIVAADKPVAYWRLDEASGTLAEDAVGTFDGTYTANSGAIGYGAPSGIPHSTDSAVTLSGGATIQVPFAPELNSDTAWSVETWVNPSSLGANGGDYRVVLSSEYNEYPFAYNGWYIYQQPSDNFAFVPEPGNAFITAGPNNPPNNEIVAGSWYHLVVTDDTTNFNVYINGQLRTAYGVAASGFVPDGDGINPDGTAGLGGADGGNFVIGQRTDAAFNTFLGTVDDTAIYSYALSSQQIAAHYADATLLTIAKSGANDVTLAWSLGALQESTNVAGGYTNVVGATSPYTNAVSGTAGFYRVFMP